MEKLRSSEIEKQVLNATYLGKLPPKGVQQWVRSKPLDPLHGPSYFSQRRGLKVIKAAFYSNVYQCRRHDPVILIFSDPDVSQCTFFLVASWSDRRGADGNEHCGYVHHVEISQPTAAFPVHPRHRRSTETASVDIYMRKRTCAVHSRSSNVRI